jgi:hypothetical protein
MWQITYFVPSFFPKYTAIKVAQAIVTFFVQRAVAQLD